jgi:N-acetyl-gamma-glutamyl-phosphate reductase
MAPKLSANGCRVLDLSADYRFTDLYRSKLLNAKVVGCPGCYPTASLLALSSLLRQGSIDPDTAIVDAKSGTSGGGRQAKTHLAIAEADNAIGVYSVAGHRHTPEIEQVYFGIIILERTTKFDTVR